MFSPVIALTLLSAPDVIVLDLDANDEDINMHYFLPIAASSCCIVLSGWSAADPILRADFAATHATIQKVLDPYSYDSQRNRAAYPPPPMGYYRYPAPDDPDPTDDQYFSSANRWEPERPANCGVYRYWNGDYCADARDEPPYVGPRW